MSEQQEPSLTPSTLSPSSVGDASRPPGSYGAPMAVRKRRKGNPLLIVLGLSAVFFVLFLMVSGYLYMRSGTSTGSFAVGAGKDSVGIVELNGVIMDSKKMLKKLRSMDDDGDVKAVVLRLNSPGGSVAPSQEIYQAVKAFKKPLVVSMSSVAASGAFYVAMGSKKVYANPGTITGSIGVIMEFADLEKLYDWAKVKRFSIKTGKFKDVGAEYRDMEPEERALLQSMVDDVLVQFKKAVSDGRKMPMEQVDLIADGRVFSGSQAKQANLVDELGTLQDAIDEAAKEGGIKGKPNVVYADNSKHKLLDLIMDDPRGDDSDSVSHVGSLGAVSGILGALVGVQNGPASLQQAITGLAPGVYWIWSGAR